MSQLRRVQISALGTYVPPRLLTNADLEKMVDTNDKWIVERTGIRERHVVDKGVATSDLAVEAAKKVLSERGIAPSDLDAILVATVTPDMFFPSTACLVRAQAGGQERLGIRSFGGLLRLRVCPSDGCAVHRHWISRQGSCDRRRRDVLDHRLHRSSDVWIFGDGAGAVLLEPAEDDSVGLIDFIHEVDGSGGCSLYMPGGGSLNPTTHETVDQKMHYVHQDGGAVFKFAVRKMADLCEQILKRNHLTGSDIDVFIPHQANQRIITATADRLKMRPESVIMNIDRFGNTTAGTIPLAMETAREEGKLKKGSLVLLASVGAGFTVGATLLRWAY